MRKIKKGDWVYCTKPMKDYMGKFPPFHLFEVIRVLYGDTGRFYIRVPGKEYNHLCISANASLERDYYLQSDDYWRVANYEENLKKILE